MGSRLDLQTRLESIPGVRKVYFQPPESIKIDYPCIIYERSRINTRFADNLHYIDKTGYTVTVIDRNPDSAIPAYVGQFELCSYDRHYASENLHHDVFTLYF